MNTKIATMIVGVLLVSIVSAGLITTWGTITGSVTVEGPVFYLSNEHIVDDEDTQYWALGINDYIERTIPISFTGGNSKWFISPSLGVDSFYAANWEISLEAESTDENGKIDAAIYVVDGDDPYHKQTPALCEKSIDVFEKDTYEINCPLPELTLDTSDRIAIILSDGANSITYDIYLKGNSKIEVAAI